MHVAWTFLAIFSIRRGAQCRFVARVPAAGTFAELQSARVPVEHSPVLQS
jgi:hypothetical protein